MNRSYLSSHPTLLGQWEGGVVAAHSPGIISVSIVAAPYPFVASWHQWDGKKEMKKETYMGRELKT